MRTTGNDANGGGFDPTSGTPGTDRSQQDAAQIAYTDLVIDAVTNTNCTSAGNAFTAAEVGNIINVTGGTGFTVQRVQVMSVAAGVATCDKSLGTLGSTGGTGNLGGALATPGMAGGLMVAGNIMWLKYHATNIYSATSTSSNVANGRVTIPAGTSYVIPTIMRGYDTTRGDETGNRPTFAWGANAGGAYLVTSNGYCGVENLILDGKKDSYTQTQAWNPAGAGTEWWGYKLKVMGCNWNQAVGMGRSGRFIECEFTDNSSVAVSMSSLVATFIGCYFHDGTGGAIAGSGGSLLAINCIFDTHTGANIEHIVVAAIPVFIINCDFYNSGGDAIGIASGASGFIINCNFETSGGYHVNIGASSPALHIYNCAGYAGTSGNYQSANIPTYNVLDWTS